MNLILEYISIISTQTRRDRLAAALAQSSKTDGFP